MSSFVLVHGSWHGAWCWEEVSSALMDEGHLVHAPDLPGHGADDSPLGEISLVSYVQTVQKAIVSCPSAPILVAHSLAGMVVASLPETLLRSLAFVVYVAAYVPRSGESVVDLVNQDEPSLTRRHCVISKDRRKLLLPRRIAAHGLYGECDPHKRMKALGRLRPDPAAPNIEPVVYDAAVLDSVTKYYVECMKDRAITLSLQRRMRAGIRFDGVFSLESDHVPMVSCPGDLAALLLEIAKR